RRRWKRLRRRADRWRWTDRRTWTGASARVRTWRYRRAWRRIQNAFRVRKLKTSPLRVVVQKDFTIAIFVVAGVRVRSSAGIECCDLLRGNVTARFNHDEAPIRRHVAGKRVSRRTRDLRNKRIGREVSRALCGGRKCSGDEHTGRHRTQESVNQ